ncbi:N-acetyl-D-glucosamine kinase-like [Daktulosphaira vitifoliae]|uniref:N-acetyl-D-glucosamine kinase-like n=1 Tax=Daktulosphaira vitifoliae TaxID=58002 RepID=UPI0021A9CDC4|nr:N-acetyl-D-glucosamine kinase-like [Daktulosphaira vitifoliae]
MEGQKNLPKEGDKGTDDLKKSKGTEAQNPEDKGQEPPCKKTHWVPTYRDVVTDDKKVALVLAGYPTNKLTTEQGLLIESCVGDLILSGTDGTDVPRFEDTRLTDGALVISAAQESSLKWLTDHVNLIKPWDGAELHLEAYNPIKYKRMVTHIPGLPKDSKKIMEILAKQNPGLNTAIWKVHHETEVGPKGQTLFLSVDENSMVKLEELKRSPYFGMGRVCFTDYVAKQPPARKDGLSLSGCEDAMFCKKIETQLKEFFPELTDEVIVVSDTLAPIALACQSGGAVIISGTGSNSLLVNPDFTTKRCGGYGHLLGDEGSAYWIAHKSIKTCVDHIEELNCAPNNYSIDNVWKAIKNHLKINTEVDLFSIFYGEDMEKSRIASLCKKIADLALKRDELSCWIFKEAGKELAKLVQTLYPSAHKVLHKENGGLHVVCVGSVWKSWDLLKNGFIEQLQNNSSKGFVQEFTLVVLDKTVALGGVYLIAKKLNYEFPFDYEHNYKILFHYVHNPNVSQ